MFKRRFNQMKPLKDRLLDEARSLREQANLLPVGAVRDAALRKARQAEAAAHMDDGLASPGPQPPKQTDVQSPT
ncbi:MULTISPECIES: hypothetical protein [unclassified Bradyrhizobium]|uniref:hypothetical protein n=1 Tax=unclassified Bradyrhizobium TaxID=2631580 RepID=UPI001BA61262|nr:MULTISPECIES: hypothetical protein [unclassified Bradyrhizobium]MBR1224211.1 hypothetical protein [Bradyrhizobium sp. AUGA SZCCT0176]MBR1301819.1 hypothetical protein [Bradyrhizobium sp. AUGA SZCCT0042]